MAFLSAFYPQPVVKGTTAGTYAEGDDSRIVGALPSSTAGSGSVLASGSNTARTLSARFAERINVKDFGAVGNGTTNDQPAIQDAINAASAGSIIYFPEGTYFLGASTGLTASKSLSFLGEKNSSTILLNKLVAIGINITGGSIFDFYNLNFVYNQGWYDSGTYASGGRNQSAIECLSGINASGEIKIINCRFENITNAIYGGGFSNLLVDSCEFIFQYGFAGCRWYTPVFPPDIGHPAVSVLATGNITKVTNCYFNGLVDKTFTGVQGNPPDKYKTPVDGIYKNGGSNPLYQEVSNCVVLNHGIEGIILEGTSPDRSYFEDASLNKSVTSLTAVDSGLPTWTKTVTATVSNHGYKIGETVRINGANGNFIDQYNGFYIIQSVETNSFTYYTKSVPSSTATGTITANVNTVKNGRKSIAKNNYLSASNLKSEYYAGTQPSFSISDVCGENCEISNNSLNGYISGITSFRSIFGYPSGVIKFKPAIKNNVIENVLYGIFIESNSQKGTIIEGNTIKTSSKFGKNQINDPRYSVSYCFHMPISFFSGEAIIKNNTIIQEDPLWDAVLTVTSRNSGTNSFTVTDGTLVSDNLVPLDFNNVQDYGVLIAYTDNKVEAFPIGFNSAYSGTPVGASTSVDVWAKNGGPAGNSIVLTFNGTNTISQAINTWNASNPSNQAYLRFGNGNQIPNNGATISLSGGNAIVGNDVYINLDYFVNQTAFTTGTMYWAKSSGDNWSRISSIWIAGGANSDLSIENNKIVNPQIDISVGAETGPVRLFGNNFLDTKMYRTSGITRIGYEVRDNEIIYFNQTGTSAPSSTPKFIGQIFVNTSANIIYMATGISSSSDWKALATWTP